jgi:glycosyltransferase involved in cell wall biosynthesis
MYNTMYMNKPVVSVIMAVYKENITQIESAISGVLDQSYVDFEFIIVLDNPLNTPALKKIRELSDGDGRVKIIQNIKNVGLGDSLNNALKVAKGKYISRMDADDECHFSDKLAKQINFLESNKNVDLLFTWWEEVSEDGRVVQRKPKRIYYKEITKNFFTKSMMLHPTMMVRREVFDSHLYPVMYRPEDLVLFLTLINEGYIFDVLEEVLYTYYTDRLDLHKRYGKIKIYAENFIPALFVSINNYWRNIYFWVYFGRLIAEFIVTRNFFIFRMTHRGFALIWKKIF